MILSQAKSQILVISLYVDISKVVEYLLLKHHIKTLSITPMNATFLLKMLTATIVFFKSKLLDVLIFFRIVNAQIVNLPKLSSVLISNEFTKGWGVRARTSEMCGRTCACAFEKSCLK